MTWIMIVVVINANRVAMTNMPGYQSQNACEAAVIKTMTMQNQLEHIYAWCVPGS